MEENLKKRGNPKGETSAVVATQVRKYRNARHLDLAGLSKELGRRRWPVSVAALSRLENRDRRIDVDDLMALAAALNISPLSLLFSDEPGVTGTGIVEEVTREELEAWGQHQTNLLREARLGYWQGKVVEISHDIERMDRIMADTEQQQGRGWARRNLAELREALELARSRVEALDSDD